MTTETKYVRSGGMGLLGWLTILFVGLKLTGHIHWPWWLVLSPAWMPLAGILGVFAVVVVGAMLMAAIGSLFSRR